tara:strand:- start:76 stop:417 length:342 start_codon:yes stop_codon:yes gene_type:complete
MYLIAVENYLDKINKTYKKILTVSPKPSGALNTIIKQIRPEKLSQFSTTPPSCIYVLKSLRNDCELMPLEEIPDLFCFLATNGYTIESTTTQMMHDSKITIDGKTILCFIKSN